jgi:hypothetical protein
VRKTPKTFFGRRFLVTDEQNMPRQALDTHKIHFKAEKKRKRFSQEECATDIALHTSAPPTSPKIAWVDGGYVDHKSADVGPVRKQTHLFAPFCAKNDHFTKPGSGETSDGGKLKKRRVFL